MISAKNVAEKLGLVPLSQEGGMVLQTYLSECRTAEGESTFSAIYYMLTTNSFSHMHRLTADEMYHFYLGDPVELLELLPDGSVRVVVLGSDIEAGQTPQHMVRAGSWQGSHLLGKGGKYGFALMGTTMSPAYTEEGYEHGDRDKLTKEYPDAAELIGKLTGDVSYI